MNKKIVILNGSPRPRDNTVALINEFTKGAQEIGNQVTTFNLDKMNINGCKGCFGGGKDTQSPCLQKDDMDKIYPKYVDADIVVIASPLYFWHLSGQVRTAFDRLFAVWEGYENLQAPSKNSILLIAAGGNDFNDVETYYNNLIKKMQWKSLGTVVTGGVNNIGDIKDRQELKQAYELGLSIS